MRVLKGHPGAWNYTIGPVLRWEGKDSLDKVHHQKMPVVIVSDWIPSDHLAKLDLKHVLGFVLQSFALLDPAVMFFWGQDKATVIGAPNILALVRQGDMLVVDGVHGYVGVDPDAATVARYQALRKVGPPPKPELPDWIRECGQQLAETFSSANFAFPPSTFAPLMVGVEIATRITNREAVTDEELAKLDQLLAGTPEREMVKRVQIYNDALKAGEIPPAPPPPAEGAVDDGFPADQPPEGSPVAAAAAPAEAVPALDDGFPLDEGPPPEPVEGTAAAGEAGTGDAPVGDDANPLGY